MWNFKPNFKCWPLKFLRGPPTPIAMTKAWSNSIACKNFKSQHPGRNIICRKSRFGWVLTHMYYFTYSGPKFTGLVWLNAGGIVRGHVFPIFDILSRSGDIHDQSRKLCKIGPNFACFWPPNFLGEAPRIFGPGLSNRSRSRGKVSWRSAEGARRSYG